MQAILTKSLPFTNTRPYRIKVEAGGGADKAIYSKQGLENEADEKGLPLRDEIIHRLAVERFCKEKGWDGALACGGTKEGYAFVFVS